MTTWGRAPVVIAAGLVLATSAACGGGGGSSSDEEAVDVGGVTAPSRGSAGEPAGTDTEAVEPYVEELLSRYDAVVNQIVGDPGVARNEDDPLMREYLSLFEPDGEFAGELVDAWVARADEGLSTRPLGGGGPISASSLDGPMRAEDDDEVSFPYCVARRYVVYDDLGRQVERVTSIEQPGDGIAVRVDGHWLLRELVVRTDEGACRSTR